ncbi:MAG: nucleotide-binding protein [SAR324 cluster bacterium]|nr:nucleotide-binding protein [SAR324 cluster bacterium]
MAFYHIVVESEKINPYLINLTDLDFIINSYVKPYVQNEVFEFCGYSFNQSQINRFVIAESNSKATIVNKTYQFNPNTDKQIQSKLIQEAREEISQENNKTTTLEAKFQASTELKKVFIIHGHDEALKDKVDLFFHKQKLETVILSEEVSGFNSVFAKFLEYAESCDYAVALFSPDDPTENGKIRPRQNVILELGYFVGLLGKDKARILLKGDVEIPSDLNGIIYTKVDSSNDWKIELANEMNAVGFNIDKSNL